MEFIEIKKWEGTEGYNEALAMVINTAMRNFNTDTCMILRVEAVLLNNSEYLWRTTCVN